MNPNDAIRSAIQCESPSRLKEGVKVASVHRLNGVAAEGRNRRWSRADSLSHLTVDGRVRGLRTLASQPLVSAIRSKSYLNRCDLRILDVR
jgi:hypothetical protein